MNYNYTVLIEAEPTGGFHASCPALKGCHSEGETEDEARANIREAIELYIESLRAQNAGVFFVDQCTLRRAANTQTTRFAPNMTAECQLAWISAQPAASDEVRK